MQPERLLKEGLFDALPVSVAVIDRDWRVVSANDTFEEMFGDWRGLTCHEAFKRNAHHCAVCEARRTFEDGRTRVGDHTGVDRYGRTCDYSVHFAPLRDADGEVRYVLELASDVTETKQWKREYDRLFENVPCYISILDRDMRIVRANGNLERVFGKATGELCYQVYKGRKTPCRECPAMLTFRDSRDHRSSQVGITLQGEKAYYVVNTSPLTWGPDGVEQVIEIATDITTMRLLEDQLHDMHELYSSLIRNAADGILAINNRGEVRVLNRVARRLLNWQRNVPPDIEMLKPLLPDDLFLMKRDIEKGEDEGAREIGIPVTGVSEKDKIPVLYHTIELTSSGRFLGRAAFLQDLRQVKRLEREKLESERLAAVGQTVAGLAHTIKNLLMGLEGGMYMVDSGMQRGDTERLERGWDMLQRNFEKTAQMVRDFLSFAKGRVPKLITIDPRAKVREVVKLYRDAATRQGVKLVAGRKGSADPAPLDPDGIEACLTNLISNAIDAAMVREGGGGQVTVRAFDDNGDLVFEVEDNGVGMETEVKRQVFTTFFTTKGNRGTGLGLLTTRKIVQEHGGAIDVDTEPGVGSTFSIRLPRARLDALKRDQEVRDEKAKKYKRENDDDL